MATFVPTFENDTSGVSIIILHDVMLKKAYSNAVTTELCSGEGPPAVLQGI